MVTLLFYACTYNVFLSVLACECSCIHTTQCSNMFFLGNRVRALSQVVPVRLAATPRLIIIAACEYPLRLTFQT